MIKPLHDNVLLEVVEAETKTASGIVLPDTAKEKPQQGEVVAIGEGKTLDNGTKIPVEVKVGDKVIFSKYAGTEVKVHGEELIILAERDIYAILS